VTHIKNQEKRIQDLEGYKKGYERLKQENKKIKEKNEKFKEDTEGDGWLKEGYKTELSNAHKQSNRMIKEITKLKNENKKWLKVSQQASCDTPEEFEAWCCGTESCVNRLVDEATGLEKENKEIAKLKNDNKNLKIENKKLKEVNDICEAGEEEEAAYACKLEEENHTLKQEVEQYKETLDEHLIHYDLLKEKHKKVEDNYKDSILILKSSVVDLREARDMREARMNVFRGKLVEIKRQYDELELRGRWTMDQDFVITPESNPFSDSSSEETSDEEY
jgi:hypothetical protein